LYIIIFKCIENMLAAY